MDGTSSDLWRFIRVGKTSLQTGNWDEMSVVNLLKHCKLLHSYLKRQYLFVLCVHIHFFGADCFADVFDVVLSAVVEYVFVLFPVVQQTKEKTSCV